MPEDKAVSVSLIIQQINQWIHWCLTGMSVISPSTLVHTLLLSSPCVRHKNNSHSPHYKWERNVERWYISIINGTIILLCHLLLFGLRLRLFSLNIWRLVLAVACFLAPFFIVRLLKMRVGVRGAFVPEGLQAEKWLLKAWHLSTWWSNRRVIAINQEPHQPHADVLR